MEIQKSLAELDDKITDLNRRDDLLNKQKIDKDINV